MSKLTEIFREIIDSKEWDLDIERYFEKEILKHYIPTEDIDKNGIIMGYVAHLINEDLLVEEQSRATLIFQVSEYLEEPTQKYIPISEVEEIKRKYNILLEEKLEQYLTNTKEEHGIN